jgi:hypothetical protein
MCTPLHTFSLNFLNCAVDHILQEYYTLFLTRFRTYKFATPPQTKMTSKDDIKGFVSLKFLCLWYEDSSAAWAWTCCSAAARATLHLLFLAHLRQAEHVFVNIYGVQESISRNRFSQPM